MTNEDQGSVEQHDQAPGWRAIDAALGPIYGEQKPLHWGTVVNYSLGGDDPLDGISVYRSPEPTPHWHFVSYGLSELYEKETNRPEVSGFGFELTFRLAYSEDDEQPPVWTLNFLQNLARYVFNTGNVFEAGHSMHLNGPIAQGSDTLIQAIAFVQDPQLQHINTPNGHLDFIQVVGLTDDEYLSMFRWKLPKILELVAKHQPFLVCDLQRPSLLENPDFLKQFEEGCIGDGSGTAVLSTKNVHWDRSPSLTGRRTTVTIDLAAATRVSLALPGRVPFGSALSIASTDTIVRFEPAESLSIRSEQNGNLVIGLTASDAKQLAQELNRGTGEYGISGLRQLRIKVEPTIIRDSEGNVVKTIE